MLKVILHLLIHMWSLCNMVGLFSHSGIRGNRSCSIKGDVVGCPRGPGGPGGPGCPRGETAGDAAGPAAGVHLARRDGVRAAVRCTGSAGSGGEGWVVPESWRGLVAGPAVKRAGQRDRKHGYTYALVNDHTPPLAPFARQC